MTLRGNQGFIYQIKYIAHEGVGFSIDTGTNEVSGTSEFLPLEPPVPVTGAGKSSLRGNHKN